MIKLVFILVVCVALCIEGTHQPDHYRKNDEMTYKTNNQYASVSYGNTYESKVKKTVEYAPPKPVYNYQSAHKVYPSIPKQVYSKAVYSSKKPVYSPMNNQYKPVYGQVPKTYKKTYVQPTPKYQHSYKSNYHQPQQDMSYKKMNQQYKPVYVHKKVTTMYTPTKSNQKYQTNYASGQNYKTNQYDDREINYYKSMDYQKKMPVYQKQQEANIYKQQYKPTYENVQNDHYKMNEYANNELEMKQYETYKAQPKNEYNNQYDSTKYKTQEYGKNYNQNQYVPSTQKNNEKNYINGEKYPNEYPIDTNYGGKPDVKSSYVVQYPSDNGKKEYQMPKKYNSNDQYNNEKYMESETKVYKPKIDYTKDEYKKPEYGQIKQQYDNNCYSSEMKPIPGDCYKFEMCSNGKRTIMKCPSNLVYDEHMKICNHKHMVKGRCGSANYSY